MRFRAYVGCAGAVTQFAYLVFGLLRSVAYCTVVIVAHLPDV